MRWPYNQILEIERIYNTYLQREIILVDLSEDTIKNDNGGIVEAFLDNLMNDFVKSLIYFKFSENRDKGSSNPIINLASKSSEN